MENKPEEKQQIVTASLASQKESKFPFKIFTVILILIVLILIGEGVYYFSFRNNINNSDLGDFKEIPNVIPTKVLIEEDFKENEIFPWGVSKDTQGSTYKLILNGNVTKKPSIDSNNFVYFIMKVKLNNSEYQELKIILGRQDWYISSFQSPNTSFSRGTTIMWKPLLVKELKNLLEQGKSVIVQIPFEFKDESLMTNKISEDCVWCKEKFEFDKNNLYKNKEIVSKLTEGKNLKDIPEMGSAISIIY